MEPNASARTLSQIRWLLGFFIVALALSGLTAFPLLHELNLLARLLGVDGGPPAGDAQGLGWWIWRVREGLERTYAADPFIAYGTDWLAFAHLVLAVFFIGPWKDPVRNVWCIQAGMIASVAVIPLALVCGPLRGIPFYWRLIDCSFGVFGILPLWMALRLTRRLEAAAPLTRP